MERILASPPPKSCRRWTIPTVYWQQHSLYFSLVSSKRALFDTNLEFLVFLHYYLRIRIFFKISQTLRIAMTCHRIYHVTWFYTLFRGREIYKVRPTGWNRQNSFSQTIVIQWNKLSRDESMAWKISKLKNKFDRMEKDTRREARKENRVCGNFYKSLYDQL